MRISLLPLQAPPMAIVKRNAGKIIAVQSVDIPNISIPATNHILTTSQGRYLVKQSDPWYLAGKITGFFDGTGVTINAAVYDRAVIPRQVHFIFMTKEQAIYACHHETLNRHSYKFVQPDGEPVYVISFRHFAR